MKENSLPRAATVLAFAPVHQGQRDFLFSHDPIFLVLLFLVGALSFPRSILFLVALASLWTLL